MSAVGDVFTVDGMPAGRVTRVLDGGLVAVAFPSPFGGDWIYPAPMPCTDHPHQP